MDLIVFFKRSTIPEDELIHSAHFFIGNNSNYSQYTWPGPDGNRGTGDDVSDLTVHPLLGLSPVPTSGTDSTIGTPDDVPGKPLVVIEYNAALGSGSPFLKRGSFICDAQNNRWYRIVSYDEVPDADAALTALDGNRAGTLGTGRGAIVRVDTPILENSGAFTPAVASDPGGAVLMRGIIDVFPLPPQLPWEQ